MLGSHPRGRGFKSPPVHHFRAIILSQIYVAAEVDTDPESIEHRRLRRERLITSLRVGRVDHVDVVSLVPRHQRARRKYCSEECYRLATAERKRAKRGTLQKKTRMEQSLEGFRGLCSVCGADDVPVVECPECGNLCCDKCHDGFGLCGVCSGEQVVLVL